MPPVAAFIRHAADPASFFLGITMFVAAFIRHAADPFMRKEKALLFLALAAFFVLVGAGRYSLDRIIRPPGSTYCPFARMRNAFRATWSLRIFS